MQVVWRKYPTLKPRRSDEEEFLSQFSAAFQFVQHHGRCAVDRQRSLGWWLDTARDWLSQHRGDSLPINGNVLIVAIIAAGDVPFSGPTEPGFVVGLQWGGGGVAARDWWKRVLGGALLDLTPPLHPMPTASPAHVRRV